MIVVRLIGGLGNQLFQYATGRAVALRSGSELKLDLSYFDAQRAGMTPRPYELDLFRLPCAIASERDLRWPRYGTPIGVRARVNGAVKDFARPRRLTVVSEMRGRFDDRLLAPMRDVLLVGFWQTEEYFVDARELLLEELTLAEPPDGKNAAVADEIAGVEAVSVHVRRGDYVSQRRSEEFHGALSLGYYAAAATAIEAEVTKPYFFVFSDDPEWTEQQLRLGRPATFVKHNPPEFGFEDLRLMSRCRHHIVANSSFSWWGAWLNPSTDKIVVAPKQWVRDPSYDTTMIIPKGWIAL